MVMEKSDVCSSIAMLQERFRQLEKVKDMREERELSKLIKSSTTSKPTSNNYNDHHLFITTSKPTSNNLFFHSEIVFPTYNHIIDQPLLDSQLLSLSLSLWPTSHNKKYDTTSYWGINIQNTTTQNLTKQHPSWLTDVVPLAAPPSLIKTTLNETHVIPDVDTTLHL